MIPAVHGRILISCQDQPGIVARVSSTLFELGANITESAQHTTNPSEGTFFMRVAFVLPQTGDASGGDLARTVEEAFAPVIDRFQMRWRLAFAHKRKRMAIFVSREDHCLQELLWQGRTKAIDADIALVVSNHPDHETVVRDMGIPFHFLPVRSEDKPRIEEAQVALLKDYGVDFVVLARYMQILSPRFIEAFPERIINIHHSFLPAFVGARPYERAYERGVKIIGATAHYVTAELDAGPIIEQDVERIHHGYAIASMKMVGRDIERTVLARAVKWHVEDRILIHENKTIVFT